VNRQRWAVPGLAVLAALAFSTAACTKGNGTAAPTTPSKSGLQVLQDAAAKTKGQSYQFALSYGTALTGQGVTSGDGKQSSLKITIADAASGLVISLDAVVLPDATYAKLNLGALAGALPGLPSPDTWIHIDPAKAPGAATLGIKPGEDSFGVDAYVKGVVSATAVSPTDVTGTIDLAKSTPPGISSAEIAKLPDAQRIVPFTANLDDQGRFAKIVIKMPAVSTLPATDLTATYSNWGAPVDVVTPPADKTVEAPPLVYTFLNQ
jgi:hypothetical protein